MFKQKSNKKERFGEKIGYILSYFVFTTILYFLLKLLNKIPSHWTYLHIMVITFLIALIGVLVARKLK